MYEIIGFLLAGVHFTLAMVGSWYISGKNKKHGFLLWMICNPINTIVILGVLLKLWDGLPLIFMLISQFYYWFTSYRGWRNECLKTIQ